MFVVISHAYSKKGNLRYKVKDVNHNSKTAGKTGYITANGNFVVPAYYSAKKANVTVINPEGVNAYSNIDLKGKSTHYKQGSVLKVKAIKENRFTARFVLSNGQYITANKKLVKVNKQTYPKAVKTKTKINRYQNVDLTKKTGSFNKNKQLKFVGWDYSHENSNTISGTLRYKVAGGGYITANSKLVKAIY